MLSETYKVKLIMGRYSRSKNSLLAILQDIQEEYNYLAKEALEAVAKYVGLVDRVTIRGVVRK